MRSRHKRILLYVLLMIIINYGYLKCSNFWFVLLNIWYSKFEYSRCTGLESFGWGLLPLPPPRCATEGLIFFYFCCSCNRYVVKDINVVHLSRAVDARFVEVKF